VTSYTHTLFTNFAVHLCHCWKCKRQHV